MFDGATLMQAAAIIASVALLISSIAFAAYVYMGRPTKRVRTTGAALRPVHLISDRQRQLNSLLERDMRQLQRHPAPRIRHPELDK